MLTACNTKLVPSVGQADNAIVLSAGISEGPAGVQTKAEYNPEASHGSHVKFTQGTALTLRIVGVWKDKADGLLTHGSISSENVTQTTTASIGTQVLADGKHNDVTFTDDQRLYWDDYGSADPANMSTSKGGTVSDGSDGRGRGLDIFAVAVDNVQDAPTVSSWIALPWNVGPVSDGAINQKSGWSTKDLLTSNNVKKTNEEETNNPYKFDDRAAGKLLEFTHAMTKVTVNLTANEGFTVPDGGTEKTFKENVSVTLLGFYYTGNVNVEAKTSTATTSSTSNIQAHLVSGGKYNHTATFDALVFPGNQFSDATKILKIEADGNIYYVDASKINVANTAEHNTFEQAKEYIFNITVNKTEIKVTATVKDWINVTADTEEPKINVVTPIGGSTSEKNNAFTSFDFYLSDDAEENHATNYNSSSRTATATAPSGETPTDGNVVWNFSPILYWPSHSTHYHMRGVFPSGTTVVAGKISVTAGDYNSSTSPSNIMVGAPIFTDANKNCNNPDHTSVDMSLHGICAREASINLNFNYMMAQVEVHLSTPASGDDVVNLANAKVEIIDGYTGGQIDVHSKTVAVTGSAADFILNHIVGENDNYRHSIIVPQALTHDATDLKFKITIFKSGSTTEVDDVYTAVIKNIKVKDPSTAETSKLITAWDSGKHYVYTLDMRKTEVKVTATITNWVTVDAEEDIWL